MLDHVGLAVADFDRTKRFFSQALAPLNISLLFELTSEQTGGDAHAGFGADRPFFWIGSGSHRSGPTHIAFEAASRAQVDRFYQAALGAGGKDNGAPGVRAHYHPNYYAAFVIDPDGHNIEAVCHAPD